MKYRLLVKINFNKSKIYSGTEFNVTANIKSCRYITAYTRKGQSHYSNI